MSDEDPPRGDGSGSTASSTLTILEGMRALGIDVAAVCAAAGLSMAELETREALIPTPALSAMWREAASRYDRGTLGLAVAMAAPFGRQVVDYVASTSPTLREALRQIGRYHRLLTRNGDLRLGPEGTLTKVELLLNLPPAAIPSQLIEFSMGSVVRRVFAFTGRRAREVHLPHAPLGPRDEYARLLEVPVRFEAASPAVLVDDDALDAPCVGHDPNLYRVVRSHADLLLARAPSDPSIRGRARAAVVGLVTQGEPDIGRVAKALATSDRSLQRRLQEEGTSFREVVDDARRELAMGYLGDRQLSVSEVAYLLGYAESSAFVRAFKRWTGKTPGEARGASAGN